MPSEVVESILSFCETGEELLPGIGELSEHLLIAVNNRENGVWKAFPEDIFIATMGCFSRFVREHYVSYGSYGFDRGFWTTRQATAHLFRIGELEYEFIDDDKDHIHIHIPSDAKLTAPLLNQSVSDARVFLKTYFPGREKDTFALESWLLSPVLKELLPSGSRILLFQAAFDITEVYPDEKDFISWIFNVAEGQMKNIEFTDLPENTSLQKSTKALLLSGGIVGSASGILARDWK